MIKENKKEDGAKYQAIGHKSLADAPPPTSEGRFCMLSEIDERKDEYSHKSYDSEIRLGKICEDFRSYAANELGLYYEIDDIRKFIAGLSVSKLLILQGMSGTGKTSLAHA
ncbi:MAG: hypothetical protein IJW92_09110, partial [Clostridia bacterium]|nr:hypothetical protein [Clostridia bacterium]